MRESFVFHSEYIADLPEEYKATFAMYTINYGLNNEEPAIAEGTLEQALWIKIARRIDQEREKYESIKAKRAEAGKKHKGNQYKQEEEKKETKQQEEKEETIEKPSKKKEVQIFEKPTIEEIQSYCIERKNNVDARSFFDFYESKGWKIGTAKMKDWKASVRTWEQRQKNESTQKNATGALWGKESDIPDEIINTF